MPWQQLVAEVGTEIDPETGRLAYREVIVSVPRQSGKTTLVLAFELQRALKWPTSQRIAYTAQTGWDARRKLVDDQAPLLMDSPLRAGVSRVLRGAGNEAIVFRNGSRIDVLATTEAAGHGRVIDLAVIDEAFSDADDRREQALLPAMATRKSAQLLVVSTMGTDASTYLNRKVEAGRTSSMLDEGHGIAYFEWSAPDQDVDIDDPSVWHSCMPALGLTIDEDVVRHARKTMSESDFRRAMLNQRTSTDERVIPVAMWNAVCSEDVAPEGRLCFGVDVNAERSAAAIAAADSIGRGELIEHRPGVGWVAERVAELVKRWGGEVALDAYGPAGSLADEIEALGITVRRYSTRDMSYACASLFDSIADNKIRIRSHPALDSAAAAARRRISGDSWMWQRRDADSDVSPLVALTLAMNATPRNETKELWAAWD
jgi:hypothetical protein